MHLYSLFLFIDLILIDQKTKNPLPYFARQWVSWDE